MEKLKVKSEGDEIPSSPGGGGAPATLPKFTPGTKGAPKKITQIKFIDPEKIKQLGLEKTIAAAVHKLKVKTQGSAPQNTEASQFGTLFGTSKSGSIRSQEGEQHRRPTTIDVKRLIKKKLLSGKRSRLNLVKQPEETLVPGKIDVILTTDTEKYNKDESNALPELQKPSEESDEPRTVVLKVINRDLKSGKIEMELIDPLIKLEKVQAVVSNSTVVSEKAKEKVTDTTSNLNVPEATHVQQRTCSSSSPADEALDSTDLFQKHLKAIFPTKPIKKVEEVARKLSFSDSCNTESIAKTDSIKMFTPLNIDIDVIHKKSSERGSLLENEHIVNCDNSNAVTKSSKPTSTCPLNFGGFFKKTTSESEFREINTKDEITAEETAVDFLLTVKDKVGEIPTEDSFPSDYDSASLTEFDNLFDITKYSNSDKVLKEPKEDLLHNDIIFGLSDRDPLTMDNSNSPYYELLGFDGDEGVIANFNHCDGYRQQAQKEKNLKPIIIENKVLSDKEKIDAIAVLSQAGHQLSPSTEVHPTTSQASSRSDNPVIIMGDDLPAQEEVELVTVYSADNSNNDVVDDYYDGDGDDVELLSVEESPESSNHSLANKSDQDPDQVEILKIISSTETSTDQVIVLSVEHNAEVLGAAGGSIEFPFDSPIKKQRLIGEDVVEVESPEYDEHSESLTETNEIIKKIEEGDDETPITVYLPVDDATDGGKTSSKSSNCDVSSDQSPFKDIAHMNSDDQQIQSKQPSKMSKPSELNEAKQEATEDKRPRKSFKPVPKLRLALKNKKKSTTVSTNTIQVAEDSKQNVEKDEVKQSRCEDEDQTNNPLDSINQNPSEIRIAGKVEQKMNQLNEDSEKQLEDYVVVRKDESRPVKSILRKDKKSDRQQDKQKKEKNSLLLNLIPESKKRDDFTESQTEGDHLKIKKSKVTNLCEAGSSKQLIHEEDITINNKKTQNTLPPNGKNPQLKVQTDRQSEETKMPIKMDEKSNDPQSCKRSSDHEYKNYCKTQVEDFGNSCRACPNKKVSEASSIQLPDDTISKNQTPILESLPANDQPRRKYKIIEEDDRSKNELKTLKPKQKTLGDYFSSCKQDQSVILQDQLKSVLQSSLNESKEMDPDSKESNETNSCTGKYTNCDLSDIAKNDLEVNREAMRLGVLKQYHRKIQPKTKVSRVEKHQDSVDANSSKAENKEYVSQFMEPSQAKYVSRIPDDKSDLSLLISDRIKKEPIGTCETKCDHEDLNVQEAEENLQIVSETFNNEVANTEEPIQANMRDRSKKKSKISILEKWSHTEATSSKVKKADKSLSTEEDEFKAKNTLSKTEEASVLNCEESLDDQKSIRSNSTPNKTCNKKSEPDSISKGHSVMKIEGDPSGHENIKRIVKDANSELSVPNEQSKVEDNSIIIDKPTEIHKKRGRKPRSLLPDVSPVAPKPPNVPVLAEISRRGRIIKLSEKRRLSEIFKDSKIKRGRKRKYSSKEPVNEVEAEVVKDDITTNVEDEVIPFKKPKHERLINSENSDSDSDVPLSEKLLKSKNGKTSAPTCRRRTPKEASKMKSNAENIRTSLKTDKPERKKKARERKYDIEIKFHPKLLLVTKREDLYKEDNLPSPPVKLKKGEVQCGFCKAVTFNHKWTKHIESHYCIGWKEGEPPVDVEDYRILLNTMTKYIRHNHIEFIYCRLCGIPMKSAIGILFHLEICKATLEERKALNFTCVCGKILTSKLWAPSHYRTCKGPPDQAAQEEIAPEKPESPTCGRKRKAVLKAEKIIKEKIKEELREEMPEDLIKPIVNKTAGYMTKWRFQLKKKGVAVCVGNGCDFTSEDLPVMHEHAKSCDKTLWSGFACMRCKFEGAEKHVVLQHVKQKHKSENTQEFQDSGSEAKIGCESSESDNESGNEKNTEKRKRRAPKRPSKHTELYSDKWKKVLRSSAYSDCLNEVINWTRNFRESNYSKKAMFTNAIPEATVLPSTTTHQYFARNMESMKFSYNFDNWCNRKFSSSIKPEIWTKMRMFESKITNDEIMTFIGGPVTNVAWVPVGDHETSKQYFAVTYKKDLNEYAKYGDDAPYKTCMLIFQLEYIPEGELKSLTPLYGVALDSGPVLDIQFLPSGGFEPALNRLGLVTVVSQKADPQIYSLPLRVSENKSCDIKGFPIIKLRPSTVLCLDSDRGFDCTRQCTALAWSKFKGHQVIAGALMNGYVAVWDISDDDNLNQIKKDGEVCIIPINLFMAADRRILAIDLHYDAHGVRWIILSTECKEVKLFDLRDVTPCAVIMDELLRTMVYSLEWPVYWENPILSYSDEIQKAVTGVFSFSPMGIMYHYRRAIKCASGVVTGSFIDWENLHVVGCVNGDLIGHRCCEWRHDVALQLNYAEKYLSYTDLISLSGDQTQLTKLDPHSLIFFDKDYKEKYGLIFSKFQRCRKNEPEAQSERDVHFTLQQYVKINRVAGNPNAFGRQLIAAGYENGLLRICLYNSKKLCS